jgi:hypothetical protein
MLAKIERRNTLTQHKSKCNKVKDRPFAEGSRGCHAVICLYAKSLNEKESHVILPLMIETLLCGLSLLSVPSRFVQCSIFSYTNWSNTFRSNFYCLIAPMTSYLKDHTQSIGRYGGLLKIGLGWRFLDAQVVSLLGAEFFARKGIGQAPHVKGLIRLRRIYNFWLFHANVLQFPHTFGNFLYYFWD